MGPVGDRGARSGGTLPLSGNVPCSRGGHRGSKFGRRSQGDFRFFVRALSWSRFSKHAEQTVM